MDHHFNWNYQSRNIFIFTNTAVHDVSSFEPCLIVSLIFNQIIGSTEFRCDKTVSVGTKAEGSTRVIYEPTSLSSSPSQAQLLISNTAVEGHQFVFPIRAMARLPLPKGPIKVPKNGTFIQFKNVFSVPVDYHIQVGSNSLSCIEVFIRETKKFAI